MICDYKCGMVVSIPFHTDMLCSGYKTKDVREILAEHYKNEKLVKVRPEGYTKT